VYPGPKDILLLVEVADNAVAFDRHTKLPLYARHRIPEAWLIDLPARHPSGPPAVFDFRSPRGRGPG
jgi:Uma2 family endonuclease